MAKKGTDDAKHHMSVGQRIRYNTRDIKNLAETQGTIVDVLAQAVTDIQTLKLTVASMQQKV